MTDPFRRQSVDGLFCHRSVFKVDPLLAAAVLLLSALPVSPVSGFGPIGSRTPFFHHVPNADDGDSNRAVRHIDRPRRDTTGAGESSGPDPVRLGYDPDSRGVAGPGIAAASESAGRGSRVPSGNRSGLEYLSANVNSPQTELGPVVSPDGSTLYFTRTSSDGDQDIWYSVRSVDSGWAQSRLMEPPITNSFNNFVESVTADGNTLLLGGRYVDGDRTTTGISISHRTANGWTFPEELKIRNYGADTRSVSNCLSGSGRILILSMERWGGAGKQDLYVSFIQPDGSWSEPKNLGPAINTTASEFAPFVAADESTLYFSSRGHGGYGDADIFVSRRLDESWTAWSKPQNLGPTINSDGWDAYYVMSAVGDFAYFGSTSGSGGQSDIVRFAVAREARPKPVTLVSGRVTDPSKHPVAATIIYETLPERTFAGSARTDPSTGRFEIVLPSGANYAFRAEAPGFVYASEQLDLRSANEYCHETKEMTLVPMEVGRVVQLKNIFFDYDKASLRKESFPELDRLSDLLYYNPRLEIEINGHTDFIGSDQYNLSLSQSRAHSVASYLKGRGIAPNRLTVKSYGKTKPVAPNETDEGRQMNRRVEFMIVRK